MRELSEGWARLSSELAVVRESDKGFQCNDLHERRMNQMVHKGKGRSILATSRYTIYMACAR